jgi:hypothetical protein
MPLTSMHSPPPFSHRAPNHPCQQRSPTSASKGSLQPLPPLLHGRRFCPNAANVAAPSPTPLPQPSLQLLPLTTVPSMHKHPPSPPLNVQIILCKLRLPFV